MKIIIFGANEISYKIAEAFCLQNDIVIMDELEELPDNFEKLDIGFVKGNATNVQSLKLAEIDNSDLFIACTKLDEANIVAAWTAKKISDIETVAFVSKLEYFKSFKNDNDNMYFEEMGIDYVLWSQELLVQEIYRIITVPEAIDVEYLENGKVRLFEYRIKADSPIKNKELKDCYFPENTLVVGVISNEELFIPTGATKLKENDKTIFIGTDKALNVLSRDYFYQKVKKVNNVSVIGGGVVGFLLSKRLEEIDISTKIVEPDESRCEYLSEKLNKTMVLKNFGNNIDFLREEEILSSDVIVNVTNSDETNLLCSLIDKQMGVTRVITRVNDENLVNIFEKAGIDVALCANDLIINELKNKIIERHSNILLTVEQGKAEIVSFNVCEKFFDKQIKDVKLPVRAVIAIIKRGKKIIIPKGDTLLRKDDKIIVFVKSEDVKILKEFIEK